VTAPLAMSESNAKALHAHWRKVNRVELGLLGLWLARERAWGHAMVEGLRRGTGQGERLAY